MKVRPGTQTFAVLQAIANAPNGAAYSRDVGAVTDVPMQRVYNNMQTLRSLGLIEHKPAPWRITDAGKEHIRRALERYGRNQPQETEKHA